jgi:sterol desaturase/sphingolipid hydroxylase (fatty acid hydroxylase superfamily)
MTLWANIESGFSAIAMILAVMAVVAAVEALVPLHARGAWNRAHLKPNVTLTFITFATNLFFNAALLAMLVWLQANDVGLLNMAGLDGFVAVAVVVIGLDFAFYVAHVAMHQVPLLWRFHSVHHSDPAVDVTTTVRQHPGEGVIRYAFVGAFAAVLGASPAAYGVYRTWSALNAILEHANIRVPLHLDRALSLFTTWPHMHKVHHSRAAHETDTNYGNIFSFFDRAFSTFTPSERGVSVRYGRDGFDHAATQTTAGLLAVPFRTTVVPEETAVA